MWVDADMRINTDLCDDVRQHLGASASSGGERTISPSARETQTSRAALTDLRVSDSSEKVPPFKARHVESFSGLGFP